MSNILFVCLGNICRSPLAEAIFLSEIRERKLETKYFVDSCATSNYEIGNCADARSMRNAEKNGIKIDHISRQITPADLEKFDWIIPMDKSNLANILKLKNAARHEHKIRLMRSFDAEQTGSDVPDPYYGGEDGFQSVFEILSRSVKGFIKELEKN